MATSDIPISFKPTDEDRKILEWLKKKLGANASGVIRQALRALKEKESK
jgi:Arc/MetJ-type ribon-helix-helix transcriptional regulator